MNNIPYHIQEIGRLYPIVKSSENNISDGRIENWGSLLADTIKDVPRYMTAQTRLDFGTTVREYTEVWVHLGQFYFKQVIKKLVP